MSGDFLLSPHPGASLTESADPRWYQRSSLVDISREAAVAWIVSDSKLVSFTSRHLGTGPTQHDTFVRARWNRVVPAVRSDLPLPFFSLLFSL